MGRSVWKWMFGVSLFVLVLLFLFTVFAWALGNVAASLGDEIINQTGDGNLTHDGVAFGEFLINSIGSPVFYMYLVDITALTVSIVALIVTRKYKVQPTCR